MPFTALYDVYGFNRDNEGFFLPETFMETSDLWGAISNHGEWATCHSSIIDIITQPIFRILAKVLSTTLLCNMEHSKMRLSVMILLYYANGYNFPCFDTPSEHSINLGLVFAHHLCTIKERAHTSTCIKEFLGEGSIALDYPYIYWQKYCRIPTPYSWVDNRRDCKFSIM